jgi:hypothetical protein
MCARALGVWRDPGAANTDLGRSDAAFIAEERRSLQVLDADGHRLPPRRHAPVPGAPTLATSSVWRWAVDSPTRNAQRGQRTWDRSRDAGRARQAGETQAPFHDDWREAVAEGQR